jgi:hypothetical protein
MARRLDAGVCAALVEAGCVSDEEWVREGGPLRSIGLAACHDSGPLQAATWDAALRALREPRTEVCACDVLGVVLNTSAARQQQACARADIIRALGHVVESGGHHEKSARQAAQALSTLFCNPSNARTAAAAILAAVPGIVPSLCRMLVSLATRANYKVVTCASCVTLLGALASWDAGGSVAAQALQHHGLADALRRVAGASRAVCVVCAALCVCSAGRDHPSDAPDRLPAQLLISCFCCVYTHGRPQRMAAPRRRLVQRPTPAFCC